MYLAAVFMLILANMQKIRQQSGKSVPQGIQISHKKGKNNQFKVLTVDGAIHFAFIICYMIFQGKVYSLAKTELPMVPSHQGMQLVTRRHFINYCS